MTMKKVIGSGGGCFRAGTQVQLENGITIAIEDIKVGDEILAFDERGDLHTAKVIKHHIHTDPQPIMRVKFWDGEIFITPNHWVLNQYNAFAEIQNLVAGHDTVVSGMGHLLPIKSKEIIGREIVYNLTVEPYHTFIADGIRVHNGGHRDRFPVITGSGGGGGGGGKGGGGAPRQAVEASDTLQSKSTISIVDLIGEGKIGGLVNGAKSIFLNNTALLSESGQYNFENTTFDSRDGSPNQSVIAGFASIETPIGMGDVEVTFIAPKTFSITNLNVDRVRIIVSIAGLYSQNKTTGDISGSSVSYAFEISVDGAAFVAIGSAVVIKGKTKSKYQRSTVLTLPNATVGYVIRVKRLTADSTTASVVDKTYLSSYVELTDAKLNYPNSALVTVGIDPTVFSSVPQRAYLVNGLYIQVPNNLGVNASGKTTGVYTGIWNGGFTTAISSNPAWILYDLLTSTRYGLGNYLSSSMVDKSMLYTIGKYCDESVSDGFGGYEPRFSINTQIQTQAEAYKIISDITSTFRGMAYWSGGMVCFRQDSPATPSMVFNQANVVNGDFSYTSSSRKDRHSVVNVTWNDPDYNYKQRVEYVEDNDLIKSAMGVKKLDVVAFGCSSRSQAQRVGRWILYTEKYESNVISFTVGLDSSLLFPGEIVRISDAFKAGKRAGGRILSSTSTSVTLDSPVTLSLGTGLTAVASISIFLAMPDGSFAERIIAQTTGSFTVLTWTTALVTLPLDNALFVLSDEVVPMLARVLAVAQDGKHADQFIVSAVEHNPSKFGAIESGLLLVKPKTSITLPYVTVLTNLHLEESTYFIAPGIIGSKVHISWDGQASLYTIYYRITTTFGVGNWTEKQVNVPIFDIEGFAETDILDVKVSGQDLLGVWSTPITGTLTIAGKSIPPKSVATFTATSLIRSIQLRWTYPVDMDIDFDHVNIRWSATSDVESAATLLTSIRADNYLVAGLNFASTPYYFWIKTVDTSGNESLQSVYVTQTTLDEAGAMVTTLNGMIGSSALNAELGTRLSLAEDSFDQFQTWYYTATAESWTAVNASLTWTSTGAITLTSTAANPQLISPTALAIVGSTYSVVKVKVNRLAGTTGWAGSLYYKTTGSWLLAKTITIPAGFNVIGGSALLEFNLKDVTAWMATTAISPVTQLRLDIGSATASGDSFSIDWFGVGRNAPGASSQALVAAQTNISGLNASYTVKIDVNGYVTGYGLASDTTNGVTTSSFAIRADRFSIANPAGPGASAPIVPFSVLTTPTTIDGSVFPAGVYINNAYITKITADKIDSRGLSIRDSAGNIILASGNALDWTNIGGTGKAANNATKTLVYSQATVPATPNEGDVWYVSATLAGYVTGAVYIYKSAAWVRTADATISQLGGSGVNILDPRFATFEEATLPPFSIHASGTLSQDATARYFGTKSLKIVTTGIGGYWNGNTGYTTNIQPNKKWIISGYVYSSTVIAAPVWGSAGIHLGVYTPSAYYGTAGYDGNAAYGTLTIPANTWTRIYGVLDLTADSNTTCLLRIDSHATGTTVWFDGIMLEAQVGNLVTPSVYQEPVNFLTTYLGDLSATRNVYKGNWATATAYVTGDIVLDAIGYGWSCVAVHTSSASILTPVYPITANTYWTLYAVKGTDAVSAILSNDTHTLPAASDGTVGSYVGSGTTVQVFDGTREVIYDAVGTSNGTWKVVATPTNIVVGTLTDSGNFLTVGVQSGVAAGTDTASISYAITGKTFNGSAISFTAQQSFSKSKAGATGTAGTDSSNYALSLSSSVISKSVLNILTPTSSTATIYKTTGIASPTLYAGRFIIATSPDGTTYTDAYTSSADESSKAYTIPVTAKTIRVRVYLAGGVTTLLDEEIITIVTDGSNGIDSVNNIVAVLNNENQSIPADNAGTTGAFSAVSTMSVYNGAVDDSANWTYTKVDSSTTSTISGATTTVTALSADTGTVTITATRSAAAQVNILSGSETFDATWSDAAALGNTGVVVATSTIPAPNGSLTAKKITANAGLVLFYRKAQTFAISQYSVSTYIYVPTQAGITSWGLSWDFADTTAVTSSIPTYYVFDKWVRVEGTATTSALLGFLDWNIYMNGAALTAGTVFHVWGAMCKTGAASGKYIPYLAPISKVFTLAKAKAGTNGNSGDSVDIVFVRSATVPTIPTASTGIPTAPITWYTTVAAANTAGGIVNPLYSSTGLKTASVGNYTWDTPVRIDGTAVAEVTVFVRSATVPATPTTGGTYTFSATPVIVAPTAPIAWSTSVPSGTLPVYTSRAVVSTSSTNTAAVTISGWSTPVISLQNGTDGTDGAQGPSVVVTSNRSTSFTATDGTLDNTQADIIFTAAVSGVTSPTYVWTFSGFQTAPANSAASTQTITAAQFGTSKSVIVTCTVSGTYVDKQTVVRLEKTTAAAGATVGADSTNLNVGLGKNILANSGFALGTDHWISSLPKGWALAGWTLDGLQATAYMSVSTYAQSDASHYFYTDTLSYPSVVAGQRYEASVYTGAHRCTVDMYVTFLNTAGTSVGNIFSTTQNISGAQGGTALTGYQRLSVIGTAPTGAVKAQFVMRKSATNSKAVGTLVVGTTYFILTLGTTTQAQWDTITGVASGTHAVGELFTCANAGVGMGTGTVYESSSYAFFALPFFAVATLAQTDLSDWSEGMSGSIMQINSTNASTYIAAAAIGTAYITDAAITTVKIGTAAITTAKIGDLAVDSLQIRGNAVTYITTYAATAGSISFNINTHGSAAYPTSLVVIAKNAMYTYNATGYSTLSVGGVQRDQSMCASSGQVFVALVTECMINVTTTGAMTVAVTQSGTTYTGSIVVNVLEIIK